MIIYLIFNSVSNKYNEKITSILKQQFDIQVNHYKTIEEKNTAIKKFKHDYRNHMFCLSSMLNSKSYQEASQYISNLSNSFNISNNIEFITGNYIADAILNEKSIICQDNNIVLSQKGIFPSDIIDNVDMCILLSNALDNAIEACIMVSSEEKHINVVSDKNNNNFFLKITNSSKPVQIINNHIYTTKDDSSAHGFGLLNMKQIAEKYNGDIKLLYENNIFTVQFILFIT